MGTMAGMDDAGIWAKRVADWRASGLTAPEYSAANGLSVNRLRYWAYKRRGSDAAATGGERPTVAPTLARVVPIRERSGGSAERESLVVEVGTARVYVGRGFDRAVFAEVVDVLVGDGGRR